jgi:Zn ribbon nucleic-acid-binding protein
MKALTNTQKKNYLKSDGQQCPACESHNITAYYNTFNGLFYHDYVKCCTCGAHWIDTYKLIDVELNKMAEE